MKKTNLRILLTSLSFFALSATFGQVDSSNAVSTDSAAVSVPQGSPVATDTTVNQSAVSTDPTSAASEDEKAAKKREKAAKKEAKAAEAEAKESK